MQQKIMVIDDDKNAALLMQEALSICYDTVVAYSGEEALSLLRQSSLPDLILLDIDMPGMNGYELRERLMEDALFREIPVVFLTGLTDEQHEAAALEQQVLDFLKKPIGMRLLLVRVRHYLDICASRSMFGSLDPELLNSIPEPLSNREQDVARLMAQFRSDREISEMLCISTPYTKKLVSAVKEKLGLEKRGDIRRYLKADSPQKKGWES